MNISRLMWTFAALLLTLTPSAPQSVSAQSDPETEAWIAALTVPRELVIVGSSPGYSAARSRAVEAAQDLGIPLQLRELAPHKETGLTFPRSDCEERWSYPCYLPRGRYDDGVYVSIEFSSGYNELRPDLYIVVIANGRVGSDAVSRTRKKAAAHFPDVYTRVVDVYLGCIH